MLAPVEAICAAKSARPPGRSLNHCVESAEATVCDQTAFNYTAEHVRVDVAAAKQKHHALSCEVS